MKRAVTLSLAALAVAACNDSSTEPVSPMAAVAPSQARFSIAGAAGTTLDFSGDIDGITTIILPSLDDAVAAEKLQLEFAKLASALKAGDKVAAAGMLASIRALLKPEIGGVGDVGAIELVLDHIAPALK
jgi:hypothetical protein